MEAEEPFAACHSGEMEGGKEPTPPLLTSLPYSCHNCNCHSEKWVKCRQFGVRLLHRESSAL
jgi:hypothetical protein